MATPPFTLKNFTAANRKRNMHGFGLMAAAQDLSWIADAASGFVVPSLAVTGTTGVYTMQDASGVAIAAGIGARVYINGVRQYGGLAYNLNGHTLTFIDPYIPQSDDKVLVELEGIGSPNSADFESAETVVPTINGTPITY